MNGQQLRTLRNSLGLTQTEFGEMIGSCKRSIIKYEKELYAPIPKGVDVAIKGIFRKKWFEIHRENTLE